MTSYKRFAFILVLSFLVAIATIPLAAQTSRGIIAGSVTDDTGAVVSGATVTATSKDTGEVHTATSGPTGAFRIEAVNPGNYSISVTQKGFSTLTINNVVVAGSVITPIDARLKVGGSETTVLVEAEANQVQTENGELSHTISTTEVTELPLQGLNPIALALTLPGVVDVGGRNFSNGTGFTVNGGRPRSNNFLIDGQDNNDNSIQGQAFQPINPNAIQEVSILTNSYSAEFGRGGASVTNVIYKGGTNRFHGSAWELYEGSGLNALTGQQLLGGLDGSTKPRYDLHTYGFSVGGPIVKDKLFFFASPQWQRRYGKAAPNTISAPTAAGAAALQAIGTPNAQLLLQYYNGLRAAPGSGCAGTPPPSGCLDPGAGRPLVEFADTQRPAPAELNPDTQWNMKIDYLFTKNDSLSFRYLHDRGSLSPDFFNFPTSLPGLDPQQGGPSENAGIVWGHTFNPKAVNEFRISYGNFNFAFAPTPEALANPLFAKPSISFSGLNHPPLFGVSSALPQGRGHTTYQFQEALTLTRGTHVIKTGFDIARLLVVDAIPFNSRGTIAYAGGGGFSSFGNFIDNFTGNGGLAQIAFGNPVIKPKMFQDAFYIQDTWKLKSNFTLDYGLRYEYQNNPENSLPFPAVDTSKAPFEPFPSPVRVKESGLNFGPRVGFAYTPKFWQGLFGQDKTVIRAGYGMFYDAFFTNILDNTAAGSPNAVVGFKQGLSTDNGGRGLAGASTLIPTISPILNPLNSVTTVDQNLTNPRTHQWNLDIQRELPGNFILTAAYVGTRGQRLFVNDQLNPGLGTGLTRVNPNRGGITVRDNNGDSIYHGFNTKVERRFSKGLLLRGAYTFGKSIDNGSEVFTITGGSSFRQDNGPHGRQEERGLSAFDVRHRFSLAYVYNVPGLKFSNSALNAMAYVTRNWEWSGTTAFQTGLPDTIFVGGIDTDGDRNANNNRPNLGNPAAPINSVGVDGRFIGKTPGVLFNNDTGAIVTANDVHWLVQPGLGNVGRNSVINPGTINFTMAVTRHFKVPHLEGHDVAFRMEMYNPFNHKNNDFGEDFNVLDGKDFFLNSTQAVCDCGRLIKFQLKYAF